MAIRNSLKPYKKPLIKSSKTKPISLYREIYLPGTIGPDRALLALPASRF